MAQLECKVTMGPVPQELMRGANGQLIEQAATAAITTGGLYMQRELARNTPEGATGKAGQSVYFERRGTLSGFVGYYPPASLYIAFPDQGTRPHWPPRGPMELYAARKFGYALGSPEARRAGFFLARAISRHGTRAQHFVERTVAQSGGRCADLMTQAAIRVLDRRLKGGQ